MEEEYNLDDLTILETPKKIKHSSAYWGCLVLLILIYILAFTSALLIFFSLSLLIKGDNTIWTGITFAGGIVALLYISQSNQILAQDFARIKSLDLTRARIRAHKEKRNEH